MGRLVVYYGNTTGVPITQFTTIISPVNYLSIQVQEIASVIRPMAQVPCPPPPPPPPPLRLLDQVVLSIGARPVELVVVVPDRHRILHAFPHVLGR
jgi:hypothetical protein